MRTMMTKLLVVVVLLLCPAILLSQDYSNVTTIRDSTFYTRTLGINSDSSINVKIQDGSTATVATVSNIDGTNALAVNVVNLPVNATDGLYSFLLNGASRSMNITGTLATPVCFRYTNTSSTQDHYVTEMVIVGNDVNIGFGKFYADPVLTNGITYSIKANNVTTSIYTFKQNEEMMSFADRFYLDTSDSPNNMDFWIVYPQPVKLVKSLNDYIELCVRDNLTGINYFTAFVKGFKK